jgi:hypothetical protein
MSLERQKLTTILGDNAANNMWVRSEYSIVEAEGEQIFYTKIGLMHE